MQADNVENDHRVRRLRRDFGPSPTPFSARCHPHPTHAVPRDMLCLVPMLI